MSSFLEAGEFPVEVVNIASSKEKGPGRPPFWEMVFWWTRKPLASARAVILASLLPADFNSNTFLRTVYPSYQGGGRFGKTPHFLNPNLGNLSRELREKIGKARLLDPFAGFGSIPLEAVRLGVGEVVAAELLPTAYIFLKAVLEYPKWASSERLGERLVGDVERWGMWVVERLREDPDLRELYDEDVAVYIGTWEVKCPYCGRYTPLVGNWWLARVKGERGFKALAWMRPVLEGDRVEIRVEEVTDPGELESATLVKRGDKIAAVEINGRRLTVGDPALQGDPNINARKSEAICLACHARITGSGEKWHVKSSLREWNRKLEEYLRGEITLEQLRQAPARPRILVKVKIRGDSLHFEPATSMDDEKLWRALEKLRQIWGDPDIPTEPMTPYGGPTLGDPPLIFRNFYKLFNPRQLLTLVKLVKLVREAGRKVEEEKLGEGWDREKAHKYAEAVTTYLAIALVKQADYNSIVVAWNPATGFGSSLALLHAGHTLSFRGIAMAWNFVEYNFIIDKVGYEKFTSMVIDGLSYLVSAVSGSPSRVRVLLDDATVLSKLGGEKFDLIVTDPPYRDDVPYAELSDFYYVWLKRALSDVEGSLLKPRFHADAFFRDGVEVATQWEWFASREVSLSLGRCKYFEGLAEQLCEEKYREMLAKSFRAMADRLSEDGVLVTYFAQSSREGWIALIEAGLSRDLAPTSAFPVLTESEESVVARGKSAITASIVVSWRKVKEAKPVDVAADYEQLLDKAVKVVKEVESSLAKAHEKVAPSMFGVTVYVMSYAKVLGLLTSGGRPVKSGKQVGSGEIAEIASELLARAYARGAGANLSLGDSVFYFLVKKVFARGGEGRRLASSSDLILLSYGTQAGGARPLEGFWKRGIIKAYGREEETEVSSRKTYILVEPSRAGDEVELAEVLKLHGVNPENPKTFKSPVHVLHALMLYSMRPKDVFKKYYDKAYSENPQLTSEALELAKALSTLGGDPEAELSLRVLDYVGVRVERQNRGVSLLDYLKR
nr:DUF1156 domain-containing protein [Thermogladius calderae]